MTTQTETRPGQTVVGSIDLPSLAQPSATATPVQALQQLQESYFQLVEDTVRHARRVTETITFAWAKDAIKQEIQQEVMAQVRAEMRHVASQIASNQGGFPGGSGGYGGSYGDQGGQQQRPRG